MYVATKHKTKHHLTNALSFVALLAQQKSNNIINIQFPIRQLKSSLSNLRSIAFTISAIPLGGWGESNLIFLCNCAGRRKGQIVYLNPLFNANLNMYVWPVITHEAYCILSDGRSADKCRIGFMTIWKLGYLSEQLMLYGQL